MNGRPPRAGRSVRHRCLASVIEGPVFEYAGQEGNRALPNILRGARVAERAEP